ncbi:MAG: ATP-binding protein [Clostridia bacterium]
MKNSIKQSIRVLSIIMVVIGYTATLIIVKNDIFTLQNLIVLSVLVICAYIIGNLVAKTIVYPIKKIDKNMRLVSEGKIIEPRHVKEHGKYSELNDLLDSYILMMKLIKKNNFDLNSQQSKTEIILEHMADGVVAFAISKQVIHINKSAMRLLEIDENYDTFDKITKMLKVELDFDKIMYLPNYKSIEVKTAVGDNFLNIIFIPFFSESLNPMGVIMMIRNITESVRLDNMRKEFVSNVSHELKTPLTSIKGYSETMMNGDLTYQEILRFSKVINQEANRMDRLVADLLQLSRFDYQRVSWKKMMFSLVDMANSVCEKMRYSAVEKGHKLECIVTVAPPNVYADRDAIEQVIMNIVSNSIKYTPDGGEIKIYLGSVNGNAYIKVCDNGIGIPEKDLGRIFERFYRVDKARSRQMGGTGLGLSIVKEMVEGNKGTIEIRSTVNVGTEVVITLPTKMKQN